MKEKRQFVMCSILLLLTSAVISCGDNGSNIETQTPKVSDSTDTAVVTEAESARQNHRVPVSELDFGGEAFFAVTYDGHNNRYYFFADEETGDVMNDAIYARRRNTEEALNVTLRHELVLDLGALSNTVRQTVSAGEDVYDQVMLHCIQDVASFVSQGYFYNIDELPYIDTAAPWWNKKQMDALRLGKNTYYAVNDYMIPYPFIVYFNRELVRNLDMPDPYEMVLDGTWTLDVYAEMAKTVVSDLDGDGKLTFENDRFGICAPEISKYISFMPAADQFITGRDADNRLVLSMVTEKTQRIVETIYDLGQAHVCYMPKSQSREDQLSMDSGRVLFYMNGPDELEYLRGCELDFGFVPYPKWDEEQKEYKSMDFGGLLCIPTTITNPEMVGAVHEFMAWDSGNNVQPTYYKTLLEGKFAQDDTAAEMLRIIFDSIVYEVGGNYFGFSSGFSDLFYAVPRLALERKSADFASFYARNEKSALKTMETFYKALDEVEEQ